MSIKKLFIIFSIYCQLIHASQKLNFTEARDKIQNEITTRLDEFVEPRQKEIKKTGEKLLMIFDFPQHQEKNGFIGHAFNMSFAKKNDKNVLKIYMSKKADIEKVMPEFDIDEMNLQWDAMIALIRKMVTYESGIDDEDNHLYFNTISDIKQYVINQSTKKVKLNVKEWVTSQGVRFELYSAESLLAGFHIKISKREDNYFMDIDFIISNANKDTTVTTSIAMITRKKDEFKAKMEKLMVALDLKNYFNNNVENLTAIQKFFEENSKIRFQLGPKECDTLRFFSLYFETQKADGSIEYVPAQNLTETGYYLLSIMKDKKLIINLKYKRMPINQLYNFFIENKVNKIFKSIYQSIIEIFIRKHNEVYMPLFPGNTLKDINEGKINLFNTGTTKGLKSKGKKEEIISLSYKEKEGRVSIKLEAFADPAVLFAFSFDKTAFNEENTKDMIEFVMDSHVMRLTKAGYV